MAKFTIEDPNTSVGLRTIGADYMKSHPDAGKVEFINFNMGGETVAIYDFNSGVLISNTDKGGN